MCTTSNIFVDVLFASILYLYIRTCFPLHPVTSRRSKAPLDDLDHLTGIFEVKTSMEAQDAEHALLLASTIFYHHKCTIHLVSRPIPSLGARIRQRPLPARFWRSRFQPSCLLGKRAERAGKFREKRVGGERDRAYALFLHLQPT